jgi:NADH:ubiquinone oxidoreductase subunit E
MCETTDAKMDELRSTIASLQGRENRDSYLIAVLHKAQELYGYLDRAVLDRIAADMNIPTAHIWGVATFYHYFNLTPRGRHVVSVCMGTACYVKGAGAVLQALRDELKVGMGETTPDRMFTLQETRCLGACALAPVLTVDGRVHGEVTPKKALDAIKAVRRAEKG